MLPTKSYMLGRTREAGSLDISTTTTYNRTIKSQTGLTQIESSHQYDDLFIQPVDNILYVKPKKQPNKNILKYDLDKIDIANDQSESENGEEFQRNESPKQIQSHKRQDDWEEENSLSKSKSSKPRDIEKKISREVKSAWNEIENKENRRNDLNSSSIYFKSKSVDKFTSENNPFLARSLSSSTNIKKEKEKVN